MSRPKAQSRGLEGADLYMATVAGENFLSSKRRHEAKYHFIVYSARIIGMDKISKGLPGGLILPPGGLSNSQNKDLSRCLREITSICFLQKIQTARRSRIGELQEKMFMPTL